MMEISEIRLNNIEGIIKSQCRNIKAEFARRIEREPQALARWWSKNPKQRRNIGNNVARDIEDKLDLQHGWLDVSHAEFSDLEPDHQKKSQLRIESGNTYNVSLRHSALLDQQKLTLNLLEEIKGTIMLLSTDKNAWCIKLIGTHPNPILNKGWGIIVEPETPLAEEEYALLKLTNGELLLRMVAYQMDDHIIAANPITGEQTTIKRDQIERADYCYIGIPPSKIIQTDKD